MTDAMTDCRGECSNFSSSKLSVDKEMLLKILDRAINPDVQHIEVNYHGSPYKLQKTENGDWIDLYCAEETVLHAGERTYISQGISMKLPEGYEAIMAPRSSTFKRWGILQTNGIGVIDNSYCGNDDIWMFPALATRDITIPEGTRICQFRIQKKQPDIVFYDVPNLHTKNRNGLGSSGA